MLSTKLATRKLALAQMLPHEAFSVSLVAAKISTLTLHFSQYFAHGVTPHPRPSRKMGRLELPFPLCEGRGRDGGRERELSLLMFFFPCRLKRRPGRPVFLQFPFLALNRRAPFELLVLRIALSELPGDLGAGELDT